MSITTVSCDNLLQQSQVTMYVPVYFWLSKQHVKIITHERI